MNEFYLQYPKYQIHYPKKHQNKPSQIHQLRNSKYVVFLAANTTDKQIPGIGFGGYYA